MSVYNSVLMFMNMNNFALSLPVLFACANIAQGRSLPVILNNTELPLQNKSIMEIKIWVS